MQKLQATIVTVGLHQHVTITSTLGYVHEYVTSLSKQAQLMQNDRASTLSVEIV